MKQMIGMKFDVKETEGMGGKVVFTWRLFRYGKEVAHGVEGTQEAAEESVKRSIGEIVFKTTPNNVNPKYKAQTRLTQLVHSRPYMLMAVGQVLLEVNDWEAAWERLKEEGPREEVARWKDDAWAGRPDLPTHGRALLPEEAAEKIFKLFREAEYVKVEDGEIVDRRGMIKFLVNRFGGGPFGLPVSESEENARRLVQEMLEENVAKPKKAKKVTKRKVTNEEWGSDS